jgi:hypothetical protein
MLDIPKLIVIILQFIISYKITLMGNNYQNLPKLPPLSFNPEMHEF